MPELMPLLGYHHIELFVGNARQAAHFYRTAFGFTPVAYAGPETGVRDRASYVLGQGDIRFVLTAGLRPDHEAVVHQRAHGDGVRDVAFAVPDADAAFASAVARGAEPHLPPEVREDERGKVVVAAIRAYGDTIHSFVDRSNYSGPFMPGYEALDGPPGAGAGLRHIDHVVANVELGRMTHWARFYEQVMGFSQLVHFDDEAISTEYTALMSKVLWDGEGRVKLPINEPAPGRRKSQIDEYLEAYGSPGVQHLALATDDVVATVSRLRASGVDFLRVPDAYYAALRERLDWSRIDEDLDALAEHGVLVDADDEGYLLQLFTKPVQDRPTVFFEIIERHGSRGFGVGNFKALFEAIEREQAARGNL
ncbi:MAG TPA: 4-hydroxyphenylpyruvate dioxygenase [Egibacteraceae bacterium]|jgi:4-hydroxyphenylpyruvate dioxygenase|nr:4-hydroxyphenylpyruvate dioxygenase [Egibacteraceae bacterium]